MSQQQAARHSASARYRSGRNLGASNKPIANSLNRSSTAQEVCRVLGFKADLSMLVFSVYFSGLKNVLFEYCYRDHKERRLLARSPCAQTTLWVLISAPNGSVAATCMILGGIAGSVVRAKATILILGTMLNLGTSIILVAMLIGIRSFF